MKLIFRILGHLSKAAVRQRWWLLRKATAGGFLALLVLGTFAWFPGLRGSITGTTVLGIIPFTDPLAMLEVMLASRSLAWEYLLGGLFLVVLTLVLGPIYCGWLCPLGMVFELNQTVRNGMLRLLGRKCGKVATDEARKRRLPRWFKYAFLGAVLGFSLVARIPIFQILSPINILARGILFGLTPYLIIVAALMILEWLSSRLWCRSLCPLGGLYGLIGRLRLLRIRIDPTLAGKTPCGQCTRACPMGIDVLADHVVDGRGSVINPDCTRCGDCIGSCPKRVLRLGFCDFKSKRESTVSKEITQAFENKKASTPRANLVTMTVDEEIIGETLRPS